MWLDGGTVRETRIIDALRAAVTPIDVVRIASLCATTPRSVLRTIGPLIKSGRVEREDISSRAMPANYRLGESEKMSKSKPKSKTKKRKPKGGPKQIEVPGTERKRIDDLDDAIAELLEAKEKAQEWTERAASREAAFMMHMHQNERTLESDGNGRKIYVYRDGEFERIAYIAKGKERIHLGRKTRQGDE
jgi:hypothetical protein